MGGLEHRIKEVEDELVAQNRVGLQQNLSELRRDLGAYLQGRAKGALVRARFSMLREMDAPSSFFFGLERKHGEDKEMHCVCLADGRVTSVVSEVREGAMKFYGESFAAENCDTGCTGVLLGNLPRLSKTQRTEMDLPIVMQELSKAVSQMGSGQAPGVDGLLVDFYRKFWGIIGQDLFEVLCESAEAGELSLSCH